MTNLMRKGAFARMINVTPGRVSQYIKARQISGAAIVGTGPRALIDAVEACRQLKLKLDIDQRVLNGLNTRLDGHAVTDDDDDGLAEVERHRGLLVDLADVVLAVEEIRFLQDCEIQDALKPHAEALEAYMAIRPRLAAIGRRD